MVILKEFKAIPNIMLKPSSYSSRKTNLLKSTLFYYETTLIPFIVLLALTFLLNNSITHSINLLFEILGWVFFPVFTLLGAAITHLIGKNFLAAFKHRLNDTYHALTLSSIFIMSLVWLGVIYPPVSLVILPILLSWAFVISVISISTMQETTRTESFIIYLFALLLIYAIINVAAIVYVALASTSIPPNAGIG